MVDKNELLEKLVKLKGTGLVDTAFFNIKKWLSEPEFVEFCVDLAELIEKEDINELNDAFYKVMPFGTGGRRGKMGVGTNRINTRTIAESAQGYSEYLLEHFGEEKVKQGGIVVTYDIRHNSRVFAEIAASVFAGNGLKVYFYEGIRSTPQLSFSIRYKQTIGGAMISASHNPPSDNGIKIFWSNGGQILPPHDLNVIEKVSKVGIIKMVDFNKAVKDNKIEILDDKVDDAYHKTVGALSLGDYRDVKIVFTPLHGCASTSFLPVLKKIGFKDIYEVEEQMIIDPNFSQVTNQIPNPEVPISLDLATKYAKDKQADIVLSADPDADRIGVVSRENYSSDNYVFLNGNQIGVLIFDYIIRQLKEKNKLPAHGLLVKTVVTTELLSKIALDNKLDVVGDLPVGFKFIGDAMDNLLNGRQFIFGAEESHGYLFGDYARDKDGAVAALLVCEYAAKLKQEGKTLFEQLEYIKKQYGYYRELLQAVFYTGMDGMDKMLHIMDEMRHNLPKEICFIKIHSVLDQLAKTIINPQNGDVVGQCAGFTDNALIFYLDKEKTMRVVVRPSGTEPKIKFYVAVGREVGEDKTWEEYGDIKKSVDDLAHKVLEEFVCLAEKISSGGNRFEVLG